MSSSIDFLIIGVYIALVLFIGVWVSRKERNSTDYFLAGRDVAWWAIGASLFAANISSEHFIGLAGAGASGGLAVGHFEWLASLILLLLAWVFVPFYLSSKVFTVPEFLEKRFDPRSRKYLATVSVIAYVMTKISVTLYAGGVVLNSVFGWDMMTSALILVIITGIYTVIGGLKAVIYTDVIQSAVLILGALLLTILGFDRVGGWDNMVAKLDPSYLDMWKSSDDPAYPWTGILFGAPILGIWYWCTDQFIVQRVLSAKNIPNAQRGAIFAGFLKLLPVFILVLPGLIAKALNPAIKGDEAYPWLVQEILPTGVRGIVMASLLAALMSSLASCFNSASTLFTIDYYKKIRPDASESKLIMVGRLSTVALVIIGILWVPLIPYISSQVWIYLQSVQAYISPPIAAVFLMGIFWPRMNANGAIAGLFTGLVIGFTRLFGELYVKSQGADWGPMHWFIDMNFLHFATFLFVISLIIQAVVSLATAAPDPQVVALLTWKGRSRVIHDLTTGLYERTNIILSVLLVALVLAGWIYFS
ncbi:MAG: sodium:solute symporter [Bacteroidetes bacterium]|nr:sodium:solute symporter [Bacteroidota bacterium]